MLIIYENTLAEVARLDNENAQQLPQFSINTLPTICSQKTRHENEAD